MRCIINVLSPELIKKKSKDKNQILCSILLMLWEYYMPALDMKIDFGINTIKLENIYNIVLYIQLYVYINGML